MLSIHRPSIHHRTQKAARLGLLGGLYARFFGGRLPTVTRRDLKRHDFPISTQRMGVRFTEGIRDTFRFRWLRKPR